MSNFGLSTNDQEILHDSLRRHINHMEVMGADLYRIKHLRSITDQVRINMTKFTVPTKCECGCITFWFYNNTKRCTNCQKQETL